MKKQYFKCTLLTDIVLNSHISTEGFLKTLDYIPGSNFLGIVATNLYKDTSKSHEDWIKEIFNIVHSDKLFFGDAYMAINNLPSLPIPMNYFIEKGKIDYSKDLIVASKIQKNIQYKQIRSGYFNLENKFVSGLEKTLQLKTAFNSEKRIAKSSQLFGYESLLKGQEFIFALSYDDSIDIKNIKTVLNGKHRLGKSKWSEFGKVKIEEWDNERFNTNVKPQSDENNLTYVYAYSNLCFFKDGLPIYQPTAADLGFKSGEIDWNHSQVRTINYTQWNAKRNTFSQTRYCISKGSVFCIKDASSENKTEAIVGEYTNEGLGKILINPDFVLNVLTLTEYTSQKGTTASNQSASSAPSDSHNATLKFLRQSQTVDENSQCMKQLAYELVYEKRDIKINDRDTVIKHLNGQSCTSSQLGVIRKNASNTECLQNLKEKLTGPNGLLKSGLSYERFWKTENDLPIKELDAVIDLGIKNKFNSSFIILFVSELTKSNRINKI